MNEVRDPVITGRLTMLSEQGKQDIYDAAVRIASEIGMLVPHARRATADRGRRERRRR